MKEILALVILTWAVADVMVKPLSGLLVSLGLVRINYARRKLLCGAGLLVAPAVTISWLLLETTILGWAFIFGVWAVTLAGLVDDLWGNGRNRGFKGHFSALLKGKATTGLLKAIIGVAAGLVALLPWKGFSVDLVIGTLLVALTANFMNLLDLRPGRAIKSFFVGMLLIAPFVPYNATVLSYPVVGATAVLFRGDLEERWMLGDAGSNALGFCLGWTLALILSRISSLVLLVILVLFHIYAERYSLSRFIEVNPLFRFLDHLGRPKADLTGQP